MIGILVLVMPYPCCCLFLPSFHLKCFRKQEPLGFKMDLFGQYYFCIGGQSWKNFIPCFVYVYTKDIQSPHISSWLQLRKQNRPHQLWAGGPQICYTSILPFFFLFGYHGEKKIVVNFPWTRLPLMARPCVDPAESAGTWYYPTHYAAHAIRLHGAQQYTPHESNFSATMQ